MSAPFVPKNTGKNNQWTLCSFLDWIDHHNQENLHDACRSDILKTSIQYHDKIDRTFCAAIMCIAFSIIIILYIPY